VIKHPLKKSTLVIDDVDDEEAVVDDGPQWMEDDFGSVKDDAYLSALELLLCFSHDLPKMGFYNCFV
jgi:hypothetical protein